MFAAVAADFLAVGFSAEQMVAIAVSYRLLCCLRCAFTMRNFSMVMQIEFTECGGCVASSRIGPDDKEMISQLIP